MLKHIQRHAAEAQHFVASCVSQKACAGCLPLSAIRRRSQQTGVDGPPLCCVKLHIILILLPLPGIHMHASACHALCRLGWLVTLTRSAPGISSPKPLLATCTMHTTHCPSLA